MIMVFPFDCTYNGIFYIWEYGMRVVWGIHAVYVDVDVDADDDDDSDVDDGGGGIFSSSCSSSLKVAEVGSKIPKPFPRSGDSRVNLNFSDNEVRGEEFPKRTFLVWLSCSAFNVASVSWMSWRSI